MVFSPPVKYSDALQVLDLSLLLWSSFFFFFTTYTALVEDNDDVGVRGLSLDRFESESVQRRGRFFLGEQTEYSLRIRWTLNET